MSTPWCDVLKTPCPYETWECHGHPQCLSASGPQKPRVKHDHPFAKRPQGHQRRQERKYKLQSREQLDV